jgi:hypothetical protein
MVRTNSVRIMYGRKRKKAGIDELPNPMTPCPKGNDEEKNWPRLLVIGHYKEECLAVRLREKRKCT